MSKVIPLLEARKDENSILVYGHFSSLHHGHIRYLRYAKSQGGTLIVALMGDKASHGPYKPQFNQQERSTTISHLEIVDTIVLLDGDDLESVVRLIQPRILIFGKEHETDQTINISKAINLHKSYGKEVKFHAGHTNYATADLLGNSEKDLESRRFLLFQEAVTQQGLNLDILLESMNAWKYSNLIVLGDTIIDQYSACEALGMSAEAPVLVVKELGFSNFIGGAAIVASHIKALGASPTLISVIGNDDIGEYTKTELEKSCIDNILITDPSRPTTFKKRYLVENQKMFRVSRLEENNVSREIEDELISKLENLAPKSDGIIISDFVYGVVTSRILREVGRLAKKYNLALFGDLQCSSQVGSVTKFKDFNVLCPNEKEARIALQDKDSGLELICQKMISTTNTKGLLMTLGSEGLIGFDCTNKKEIIRQSFPALTVNPIDVTGAGDSILSVMAAGISSGESLMKTTALACCMASVAVKTMGNKSINTDQIKNKLIEVLS